MAFRRTIYCVITTASTEPFTDWFTIQLSRTMPLLTGDSVSASNDCVFHRGNLKMHYWFVYWILVIDNCNCTGQSIPFCRTDHNVSTSDNSIGDNCHRPYTAATCISYNGSRHFHKMVKLETGLRQQMGDTQIQHHKRIRTQCAQCMYYGLCVSPACQYGPTPNK